MNLPEQLPEDPTVSEFKDFSFASFLDGTVKKYNAADERLIGSELFSLFTADIIKEDVVFTR